MAIGNSNDEDFNEKKIFPLESIQLITAPEWPQDEVPLSCVSHVSGWSNTGQWVTGYNGDKIYLML